jgi:hypothetical protein
MTARVATALALILCGSAQASEPRLFVYGDSIAIGTQPHLEDELAGWKIRADMDYARKARTAAPALKAKGDRLAPVVHVSLGTVANPKRPEAFRRHVRAVMRAVGDRCVVWANIYRPLKDGDRVWNGWRPLNRVLAGEAGRWSNLVVVDWASMVEKHLQWRSSVDGTHVSERGYRARARAVAQGVRECSDRLATDGRTYKRA